MESTLPKRKVHHLRGYDYGRNGAYFITICTHQRRMLFGSNRAPVGADSISARMAARVFREIIGQYPTVQCHYFVVMPNHFHALVEIERARADMESAPTFFGGTERGTFFPVACVGATIGRPSAYRRSTFFGTVFLQGKRARASNARPYKSFSTVCKTVAFFPPIPYNHG